MNVYAKNQGKKLPYRLGTKYLYLGFEEEIKLDLDGLQRDEETILSIYRHRNNELSTEPAEYYAAQVIIPPAKMVEVEQDNEGETQTIIQRESLDFDDVTLVLWSIEE